MDEPEPFFVILEIDEGIDQPEGEGWVFNTDRNRGWMRVADIELYPWDEAQARLQELLREGVASGLETAHRTLLLQRWEPFDLNGRWVRSEHAVE